MFVFFQMQHHLGIDMSTLSYTKLSHVTELLSIDVSRITVDSEPDVLDLNVERSFEVTAQGNVTALIYWFELVLDDTTVVSTLDSRHHWTQAAIIVKHDLEVGQGQLIGSKVILQNSNLDVKFVTSECSNGRH